MNKTEADILLSVQRELDGMARETPEMPEDFHAGWMRAVEKEKEKQNEETRREEPGQNVGGTAPKRVPVRWIRAAGVAAAVVFLIGGTLLTRNRLPSAARLPAAEERKSAAQATSAPAAGMRADTMYSAAVYEAEDSAEAYEYDREAPAEAAEAPAEAAEESAEMKNDAPRAAAKNAAPEARTDGAGKPAFGERLGAAFTEGLKGLGAFLEDMAVFLAAALPYLAPVAAAAIAFAVIRRKRARGKNGSGRG